MIASNNCDWRTGLVMWPAKPMARSRSGSTCSSTERRIMRTVPLISARDFTAAASSNPSITGMSLSTMATRNGASLRAAVASSSRARSPSGAVAASNPQLAICSRRISRWMSLSSTARTRSVRGSRRGRREARGGLPSASKATVNQNVEPRSGSLSTPIVPPINSASFLEMASPRPVPP